MRQHAILSFWVLLIGWGLFFGATLFQSITPISGWIHKTLFLSIIPLSLSAALWNRQKCQHIVFKANIFGFIGLFFLLGLRLYADLMQQSGWKLFSILLMIPFIVLASLGYRAWLAWCFPSLTVLFANPKLSEFSFWMQAKVTHFMEVILPWAIPPMSVLKEMPVQIVPLSDFSIYWIVITAFYGYLRYQSLTQRSLFYGLSLITFFGLACIQACGLSGLLYWGGSELLSRFNLLQLNQVLIVLGLCFLAYVVSILLPYRPPMRRMMNGHSDFVILIDRHSHWLALTVIALVFMALSAWLGDNVYRMSLSITEIWR